jgi:nuclear protein localization protein 4 homolog
MSAFKRHMAQVSGGKMVQGLSDFHLLHFLVESHVLEEKDLALLCRIAREKNEADVDALVCSNGWQTLMMIAEEASSSGSAMVTDGGGGSSSSSSGSKGAPWACRHCTFVNLSGDGCSMCGLPKDG